jgi:segregation and condensation protein A
VVAFDQVSPLGELYVRWAGADDEDVAADLAAIDEFEGAPGDQPADEEGEGADEPAASA